MRAVAGLAARVGRAAAAHGGHLRPMALLTTAPPVAGSLVGSVAIVAAVLATASLSGLLGVAAATSPPRPRRAVILVTLAAGTGVGSVRGDLVAPRAALLIGVECVAAMAGTTIAVFLLRCGRHPLRLLPVTGRAALGGRTAVVRDMATPAIGAVRRAGRHQRRPLPPMAGRAGFRGRPVEVRSVAVSTGLVPATGHLMMAVAARFALRTGHVRRMAADTVVMLAGRPALQLVSLLLVTVATACLVARELVRRMAVGAALVSICQQRLAPGAPGLRMASPACFRQVRSAAMGGVAG